MTPQWPTEPSHRPWRVGLGVLGIVVATLGGMGVAWWWPEASLLHFWLIAQCVPLLYLLLIWAVFGFTSRGQDVD